MITKRLVITIALAAFILTLIPAAFAAGGTISGKIAFPANTTTTFDMNKSVNVTVLTIYAMNLNTNFVNYTHPNDDGTYSVHVPENGKYRVFVSPNEIIDATDYDHLKLAQYPDMGARTYVVEVSGDLKDQQISYFAPGQYVPPNEMTGSPSPAATVTPKPTSGFAILLALVGLVGAFVIVSRRK